MKVRKETWKGLLRSGTREPANIFDENATLASTV